MNHYGIFQPIIQFYESSFHEETSFKTLKFDFFDSSFILKTRITVKETWLLGVCIKLVIVILVKESSFLENCNIEY